MLQTPSPSVPSFPRPSFPGTVSDTKVDSGLMLRAKKEHMRARSPGVGRLGGWAFSQPGPRLGLGFLQKRISNSHPLFRGLGGVGGCHAAALLRKRGHGEEGRDGGVRDGEVGRSIFPRCYLEGRAGLDWVVEEGRNAQMHGLSCGMAVCV